MAEPLVKRGAAPSSEQPTSPGSGNVVDQVFNTLTAKVKPHQGPETQEFHTAANSLAMPTATFSRLDASRMQDTTLDLLALQRMVDRSIEAGVRPVEVAGIVSKIHNPALTPQAQDELGSIAKLVGQRVRAGLEANGITSRSAVVEATSSPTALVVNKTDSSFSTAA